MGKCPVCNAECRNLVCAACGFDSSADREAYPTLIGRAAPQKAKSSLKGALRQLQKTEPSRQSVFGIEEGVLRSYHGKEAQVVVPDSVTAIRGRCFEGCTTMEKILLPEGLEEIDSWSFKDCTSLKKISIPSGVKRMGYETFRGCTALREVQMPEKLGIVLDGLFKDCSSLRKIVVPASVRYIGKEAFAGCTALRDITICSTDTVVELDSFANCPGVVKKYRIRQKIGSTQKIIFWMAPR